MEIKIELTEQELALAAIAVKKAAQLIETDLTDDELLARFIERQIKNLRNSYEKEKAIRDLVEPVLQRSESEFMSGKGNLKKAIKKRE